MSQHGCADDLNYAVSKNMHRFENLVRAMEDRHAENQKMINDLLAQVRDLKSKNKALDEMVDRYFKKD
jgi:ABC-type phosphate transport system auxiliary subunit